jgi:hypothetical protein
MNNKHLFWASILGAVATAVDQFAGSGVLQTVLGSFGAPVALLLSAAANAYIHRTQAQ